MTLSVSHSQDRRQKGGDGGEEEEPADSQQLESRSSRGEIRDPTQRAAQAI